MKQKYRLDIIAGDYLNLETLCDVINHSNYLIYVDTEEHRIKAEPIFSKDGDLTIEFTTVFVD